MIRQNFDFFNGFKFTYELAEFLQLSVVVRYPVGKHVPYPYIFAVIG